MAAGRTETSGLPRKTPAVADIETAAEEAANAEEEICRRCTKCCYRKIIIGGEVLTTPFPCEFLDEENKRCRVYARRKEFKPNCLTVREGMRVSAFPADCAYVPSYAPPGYRPARTDWDWGLWWDSFDELADALGVSDRVRKLLRARGPHGPLPWERRKTDQEETAT